jgi:hypothetical protein
MYNFRYKLSALSNKNEIMTQFKRIKVRGIIIFLFITSKSAYLDFLIFFLFQVLIDLVYILID